MGRRERKPNMGYETADAADRYWHGLPVGPHFLDKQYLVQPILGFHPAIDYRLEAVLVHIHT
jgi:hypothetical protein